MGDIASDCLCSLNNTAPGGFCHPRNAAPDCLRALNDAAPDCLRRLCGAVAKRLQALRQHLHLPRGCGDGGRTAFHLPLLDGVDQLVGGHGGIEAPLAEVDVPPCGVGPGPHVLSGAEGAGIRVEADAGEVRAQPLAHPGLDLLRSAGPLGGGGKPVSLPLRLGDLVVQKMLPHPLLHQFLQPGAHAERLGVRPQSRSRLPLLGGRGGRLCMVLRRPAARSVNLRHPYSSCLICEG